MKNILIILMCALVGFTLASPAMALTVDEFDDKSRSRPKTDMPEEVIEHWELATEYKEKRRYELARQHFLLALASCNTTELRDALQRELQLVDLQIRTLR